MIVDDHSSCSSMDKIVTRSSIWIGISTGTDHLELVESEIPGLVVKGTIINIIPV